MADPRDSASDSSATAAAAVAATAAAAAAVSGAEKTSSSAREAAANDGLDLDDLLPQVGEFGRYQKLLLWLVCLPACIPCGFGAFTQLFMADVPSHWCRVTELHGLPPEMRRHLTVPPAQEGSLAFSQCNRYAVNWTELLENYPLEELQPNSSWPIETCSEGWEYNLTEVPSSIVIDFDLVCDHAIYPTIGLAALNLGGPIGVYVFGLLNDRLGRRFSFFSCLAVFLLGSFLTAISPDFWSWAGSRIVVGLTIPAIYQIPFIISLELVGPSYRSFVTVMTCLFYTLGLVILTGVTYLVRDWVLLALCTSAPFLLYFIYWWFLPESPRWLLARGRLEEGAKILETLAKVNQKSLPPSFKQKLKQKMMLQRTKSEENRMKQTPGMLLLFKTPNMRLKTILITLNWFANNMVYVGLSYYGPSLGSNQYISFLLSSIVEIPSYLACWVVMDRWGRRWPLCISMIISGVSCIVTVLLPEDAVIATLALFLISKFAISASFLIIYPFAGELYPTQLRGIGIGTSAYISGLGLILIPFITYLGTEVLVMPLVIMGVISVVGGLSGLRLPETLHHRLPQTIEEGEEFGKDWTIAECLRCIPTRFLTVFKPEKNSFDVNRKIDPAEIEYNSQKPVSNISSYEDLDEKDSYELSSQTQVFETVNEVTPLERQTRRQSVRTQRLVRQSSVMETPIDSDGAMKLTYWF